MDVSKFKTSDWLKMGGGLLFLIAFFLPWWQVKGFSDANNSGSDYFLTGIVPLILLVAAGVITFMRAQGKSVGSLPWPLIFLAAAALSVLLLLWRLVSDGTDAPSGLLERGIGLYLAFVASIVFLVGSFLGFKEAGGDLNDLKDMNKLKASFSTGSGSTAAAPPAPSMQPPPPPAPPAGGDVPPPPPPSA